MRTRPKKIDPKAKERCVRQVLEILPEQPSLTAAAEAVARREGLGSESMRRWVVQAQIDGDQRRGTCRHARHCRSDLAGTRCRRAQGGPMFA